MRLFHVPHCLIQAVLSLPRIFFLISIGPRDQDLGDGPKDPLPRGQNGSFPQLAMAEPRPGVLRVADAEKSPRVQPLGLFRSCGPGAMSFDVCHRRPTLLDQCDDTHTGSS